MKLVASRRFLPLLCLVVLALTVLALTLMFSMEFLVENLSAHTNWGCITECPDGDPASWWCPPYADYSTCYCSTSRNNYVFYSYSAGGSIRTGIIQCD